MEGVRKLAVLLYGRLERRKNRYSRFLYNACVREDLKTLYPMQDITKRQKEFVIEKLSFGMLILFLGVMFGVLFILKESGEGEIKGNQLVRNPYEEGERDLELYARNGEESARISLELSGRQYTDKELEEKYQSFFVELETIMLGQNSSLDEVCYDLNLVDEIEGYPFLVTWETDEEYIDQTGKLLCNEVQKPVVIELLAEISCEAYERQESFWCCIRSRASPLPMQEQLQRQLEVLEEAGRENAYLVLPAEYGGKELAWSVQTGKSGLLFLLATPLVCVVLLFSKDKDLHKRVEEREEQMKIDYPELVSKLALLLGSGMTVPNAWQRMVADYVKKQQKKQKRYAYEEMLLTANELKNGVYQSQAFEDFGRRCKLPCYSKLVTLLTQNLRSGSVNLAIRLQEEALEAFAERKHMARRQGEKAGTKLLAPMMMLLGIVMVIIIVPTFLSGMG